MTREFGCSPTAVATHHISQRPTAFSELFFSYYFHPSKQQKCFPIIFFPADFSSTGSEWFLPLFPHMLALSFNQTHLHISHLINKALPGPRPPSELAQTGAALTKWHQAVCTPDWAHPSDGGLLLPTLSESCLMACACEEKPSQFSLNILLESLHV